MLCFDLLVVGLVVLVLRWVYLFDYLFFLLICVGRGLVVECVCCNLFVIVVVDGCCLLRCF